jgi:AMP-polyphosphate phosphotransferase
MNTRGINGSAPRRENQTPLSYEDFRNRARWPEYEAAIEDMMDETSTRRAPWHLIPANSKPYGRIAAFRIIKDRLGRDVSLEPRPIDPNLIKVAKRALGLSPSDIERAAEPAARKVRLNRSDSKSRSRPA